MRVLRHSYICLGEESTDGSSIMSRYERKKPRRYVMSIKGVAMCLWSRAPNKWRRRKKMSKKAGVRIMEGLG